MLPNWHEAAVVYLAATLAGMVVNPILPSLRDAELRFILADADVRMIFIPEEFRGFDYAAMLTETILLGNVAMRAGRELEWDGPSLKFTNHPEANKLLHFEYRKGWKL